VTNTQRQLSKIKKVVKSALKPALNRDSGWPVFGRAQEAAIASIILKMIKVVIPFSLLMITCLYIK
jgi:hypothetical protein